MKLLHRNIIVNALTSLVVIFLGGLITWFFLVNKIKQESEEHLLGEKAAIEEKLEEGLSPETFTNNVGDEILIKEISSQTRKQSYFKSVTKKEKYESDNEEEEEEEGEEGYFEAMALVFEYHAPNKNYQVTIIRSADNNEELDKNILAAVSISAILVVLSLMFVNFFIYKKLWDPFYSALREVQNFNISTHDGIHFPSTSIKEFQDLNHALSQMERKILNDFHALKEFTENASHEIQTPLAVISSKIEMCLQEPNLSQQQVKLLAEASHAVSTLSNLNKGLLILTKLDNNQFDGPELISTNEFVRKRMQLFDDFIKAKNIQVSLNIEPGSSLHMNPLLAETLIDNLLKNAIKHNFQDGALKIESTGNILQIANTGAEPRYDTEKMFERFFKDSREESLGLGLALAKKICDTQGYTLSYEFRNGEHILTLKPRS
jgi:signal transduction histidine kinase